MNKYPAVPLSAVIQKVAGLDTVSQETVEHLSEIISRPVVKPPGGILQEITCCNCSRTIKPTEWEIRRTPVTNLDYVYALHKTRECRGVLESRAAVVVCCNCRSMLLIDVTDARAVDGFKMHPKSVYHILRCAYCDPQLTQITVVEQLIASKKRKTL